MVKEDRLNKKGTLHQELLVGHVLTFSFYQVAEKDLLCRLIKNVRMQVELCEIPHPGDPKPGTRLKGGSPGSGRTDSES